jgi:hypothetical protein
MLVPMLVPTADTDADSDVGSDRRQSAGTEVAATQSGVVNRRRQKKRSSAPQSDVQSAAIWSITAANCCHQPQMNVRGGQSRRDRNAQLVAMSIGADTD